jgi:5,10-methylenetetrahydrofolate reductase
VLLEDETGKKVFYSFEYFPARTEQGNFQKLFTMILGIENLLDRIERMGTTNPLWVDVTW